MLNFNVDNHIVIYFNFLTILLSKVVKNFRQLKIQPFSMVGGLPLTDGRKGICRGAGYCKLKVERRTNL